MVNKPVRVEALMNELTVGTIGILECWRSCLGPGGRRSNRRDRPQGALVRLARPWRALFVHLRALPAGLLQDRSDAVQPGGNYLSQFEKRPDSCVWTVGTGSFEAVVFQWLKNVDRLRGRR